ncbi:MAG: acetyl-CoA carboxylase carboxyltransferase subunit alpha [Chitinispirillaceae bacterium]|nr:acetyl-CoA carboxylase carboxyltransferase subunit alpha [Chitinispirillaceae bacterium]
MERPMDFEKPILDIEKTIERLKQRDAKSGGIHREKIAELERRLTAAIKGVYEQLTPWQTVQIARHPDRPVLQEYIRRICTDFIELHGDRAFADDRALIGGFATIGGEKVMLIGHNRGTNVDENFQRNFGMARPEGYRKAMRLMRLAEKFKLPVVSFIDTMGAYPGLDAEERGQHEAIARNLYEMSRLQVPLIIIVIGEGGSGGALGIGVGDEVLMLSNAIYSVISPEGCASILWRDGSFAPQAAEALKLTARSLHALGVIDEVIPEPVGGAHRFPGETATALKEALQKSLKKFSSLSMSKLIAKRFEKISAMGIFNE